MKTNKRLTTSTFCKSIVKQFVTVSLLYDKNNVRDTNYFTNFFTNS